MPRLASAAALAVAAHIGLLATFDLTSNLPWFYLWLALGFGALWLAERAGGGSRSTVRMVLGVAIVLRILLLPLPPTLSDDVLRYVWDGRVALSGSNPYALSPEDAVLEPLRDELWLAMAHKDVATVYPPLALGGFIIASSTGKPILVWKMLLALVDVATCWLLLLLCRRWGLPPARSVWYAWNPLVTLELAGMGHVDGLGVFLVIAGVVALGGGLGKERRKSGQTAHGWWIAGLCAAGAVLAKLVPLLLVPLWARWSRRGLFLVLVSLAAVGLGMAPVIWSVGGVPPGLTTFGVHWEFNGPLYEPLWRGLERIDSRATVEAELDARKVSSGDHDYWNRFYPYNYSRLHAKLLLSGLLGVLWLYGLWRVPAPLDATGWVFATVILCSATVYPWYLIWLLPWAALRRRWEWRLLSMSILLAYVPQFAHVPGAGTPALVPWVFAAIWAPLILTWPVLRARAAAAARFGDAPGTAR